MLKKVKLSDMWRMTHDMWQMTHEMWHMKCNMWPVTHMGWWALFQNLRVLALTVWKLWFFEDGQEKDDWLAELINELVN